MKDLVFYLVDVFATKMFSGNQLAVFPNASLLSNAEMQSIANEMHFSETTFIVSDKRPKGGFNVKIFTPFTEVPFAGHPSLGTAYVIKNHISDVDASEVLLNLKVGQIQVTFEKQGNHEILWMKQIPPTFGRVFELQQFANVLQINEEDFDKRYPIQSISTGLPFVIVPLKSLAAVRRARINTNILLQMANQIQGGILVFCPQTYRKNNDINARVFVDLLGIPEDPATGSGNGCLAGYLSRYRYFGADKVQANVEQGYEISRPSLLLLKAEKTISQIQVEVGGRVFLIAKGELRSNRRVCY